MVDCSRLLQKVDNSLDSRDQFPNGRSGAISGRRAFLTSVGVAISGLSGCLEWKDPFRSDDNQSTNTRSGSGTIVQGELAPDDNDGPTQLVQWNKQLFDIIRFVSETPTGVTRHLAIFSLGMYDAVATISLARGEPSYEPYGTYNQEVSPEASRLAAIGGAAHEILSQQYPAFNQQFDETLAETLDRAEELGGDISAGEEWGRFIAMNILESREDDGHDEHEVGEYNPCENPSETPGCWRGGNIGTWRDSHYAFLDPWVVSEPVDFCEPRELTSKAYAEAWHEVYELGGDKPDKPQEQVDIATFWRGGAGTTRPSGRWYRIANLAITEYEPSLLDSARLFAIVGIGLGDAGVSTWRSKHRHGFWRPATAIELADTDGNPETNANPDWQPISVGGGPEYPSALACYGSTVKTILEEYFGTDAFSFELHSSGPPEQTRSFEGFSDALEESILSRLYIGNHFRFSLEDAIEPGETIAEAALEALPPTD